jgi:hypothetical protein
MRLAHVKIGASFSFFPYGFLFFYIHAKYVELYVSVGLPEVLGQDTFTKCKYLTYAWLEGMILPYITMYGGRCFRRVPSGSQGLQS